MLLAIDTETTGVDFNHGAKPYFVTLCSEDGEITYYEWPVDPLTRQVKVCQGDLDEIWDRIQAASGLVMQNGKFDVRSLASVRPSIGEEWPWEKTEDTLIAGHLLASNKPHNLTDMVIQYVGRDINKYEIRLREICNKARTIGRKLGLAVAKEGRPDMPSAKAECWKFDMWLPSYLYRMKNPSCEADWGTALQDYANADSEHTMALWLVLGNLIARRGLTAIYRERMRVIPVTYRMERQPVTINRAKTGEQIAKYTKESLQLNDKCVSIAGLKGYELVLPKSGNNKSLETFATHLIEQEPETGEGLRWPKTETGKYSLSKVSLKTGINFFPEDSPAREFFLALMDKRSRDTAISYMEAYKRFWLPSLEARRKQPGYLDWYNLFPHLNPTGTDTLRFSSSNPNEQNISKKEGFNLRACFGPMPGRKWYSCDAENVELRIPAYEAGEQAMIALFERPDEPPYFGSNHLLVAHILYPKEFEEWQTEEKGWSFKKQFASTLYQWVKNGNFAVQYGAIESSGTADRAYRLSGAQRLIQSKFKRIAQLNERLIQFARRYGYVETVPDKTVDLKRGYPLLCTRTIDGNILPTVPLNYHVQGTAMWFTQKAMIRCDEQLRLWKAEDGFDGRIVLQVHDELVFDFPSDAPDWRIFRLRKLMEQGGDDIGIPIRVGIELHTDNWSKGVKL